MRPGVALAAGLAAVGLAIVMLFLAAGGFATTEQLAAGERVEGIELARVGVVGDFPDPAHRHVFNVTADGRVLLDGRTLATYGDLEGEVGRLARLSDGPALPGTRPVRHLSGESFVVRADRAAPWGVSRPILQACAFANAPQVFFAVLHAGDGTEGAVATFLPIDDGSPPPSDRSGARVVIESRPGAATPRALYDAIVESQDASVLLDAAPEVATGTVLGFVDAASHAFVRFDGFALGSVATPQAPLAGGVAAFSGTPFARIADEPSGEQPPDAVPPSGDEVRESPGASPLPAAPRRRGGFVGTH